MLANITCLIEKAKSILVVVSDPVDPDCVGSALAMKWFFEQQHKAVDIVSFSRIPRVMESFPDIADVVVSNPKEMGFAAYDVVMLLDGSSWGQFFGREWKDVLARLDRDRVVNIDHHREEDIYRDIPHTCLNEKKICTAQIIYEHLIKPILIKPPARVAEYLYRALIDDARMFKNEVQTGQYLFAEELIALGANHLKVVDTNYDKRDIEFLVWGVEHTEFIPELQLTMLVIDAHCREELTEKFGANFMDFDKIYKETIQRQIDGYSYGIILLDTLEGSIRLNWRTRNYGEHLSIADVARRAGFGAGGHRNAGGGRYSGSIEEARERLLQAIRSALTGTG